MDIYSGAQPERGGTKMRSGMPHTVRIPDYAGDDKEEWL
jgi:hypothetical protein